MRLSNLPQRCTLLLWLFSVFISFLIRILFVFSVLFRVFSVPGLVLLPFLYSLLPSSFASAFLLLLLSPISPVLSCNLCDSLFIPTPYDTSPSSVLLIVLPVLLFPLEGRLHPFLLVCRDVVDAAVVPVPCLFFLWTIKETNCLIMSY
jgi:hypothetical protein